MALSLFCRLRAASSTRLSGFSIALLAGITLLASGCHQAVTDPKDPKFIVAEKGDWKLTRGELDTELAKILKTQPQQPNPSEMPMLETAMLDRLIMSKLLTDKAATMQLKGVDEQVTAMIEQIKGRIPPGENIDDKLKTVGLTMDDLKKQLHEEVVCNKVVEQEALQNSDLSDQEINAFYLKYKDKFVNPPTITASRILVHVYDNMKPADKATAKKTIDKAYARVSHGEDFAKVASEMSEDVSSKMQGGNLGPFPQGINEPEFDAVAFKTKQGAVSPVFETPLGYQIVKVTAINAGGPVSVAEARPTIIQVFGQKKKKELVDAYTKKLLATGGVTVHLIRVDPPAMSAQGGPGGPGGPDSDGGAPDAPTPAPAPGAAPAPAPTPAPAPSAPPK